DPLAVAGREAGKRIARWNDAQTYLWDEVAVPRLEKAVRRVLTGELDALTMLDHLARHHAARFGTRVAACGALVGEPHGQAFTFSQLYAVKGGRLDELQAVEGEGVELGAETAVTTIPGEGGQQSEARVQVRLPGVHRIVQSGVRSVRLGKLLDQPQERRRRPRLAEELAPTESLGPFAPVEHVR